MSDLYGLADLDHTRQSLQTFFGLRRGNADLRSFMTQFTMYYDEAIEHAGLQINGVGKSFLLMELAGTTEKRKEDIRIHTNGNITNHNELYNMLGRLAKTETTNDHQATLNLMNYGTEHHED